MEEPSTLSHVLFNKQEVEIVSLDTVNTTLHPDEWKITVTFTENRASGLGDAIYTDSIQSCIWPDQHSPGNDKPVTFCWKGWSFIEENNVLIS